MRRHTYLKTLLAFLLLISSGRGDAAAALGSLEGVFLTGATTREPFKFDTGRWNTCENVFYGSFMVTFCNVEDDAFSVKGREGQAAPRIALDAVKISVRSWQQRVIREYIFSGWWSETTATGQAISSALTVVLWRFVDDPADTYKGSLSLDDLDMSQALQAWRVEEAMTQER